MLTVIDIHLRVAEGREVEAAKHLASQMTPQHWKVLATLAAEILQEHEARLGSSVVLVAGADQAERVLKELKKAL